MSYSRRVLLLGGSGQLGSEIRRLWTQIDVTAPSRAELDITDCAATEAAIEASGAGAVLNCAAFHNVERCETDPGAAFAANAKAVDAMARACARTGALFVTLSTDYVFDGMLGRAYQESDEPHPISAYGISKYAGELLVRALDGPAYIVRTCGVYGRRPSREKGYTFVDRVIEQARSGQPVRVVRDQTVTPTSAVDLALGLLRLLQSGAPYGVYHMVNEGAVTWYDYAREALRLCGANDVVEPISYLDWNSAVRRPAFSALENAKLHALGMSMPDWRAALTSYVERRESVNFPE